MLKLPQHTCPPASHIPELPSVERRKRLVIVSSPFSRTVGIYRIVGRVSGRK